MSIVDVASVGDHLESLRALRDVLARAIVDYESGPALASLSRQFQECLSRISELESGAMVSRGSPLDDVAERRARRAAG